MSRALTPKQQAFLDALLGGAKPVDAYRAAYDCSGMQPRAVTNNASKLARHPTIALAIQAHRDQVAVAREAATAKACEDAGVTRERVVAELAALGFADIRQVITWAAGDVTLQDAASLPPAVAAAIAEIKQTKDGLQIKLHSKLGALQGLAKILKLEEDPDDAKNAALNLTMNLFGKHK
jgi:phage terminase small subunit